MWLLRWWSMWLLRWLSMWLLRWLSMWLLRWLSMWLLRWLSMWLLRWLSMWLLQWRWLSMWRLSHAQHASVALPATARGLLCLRAPTPRRSAPWRCSRRVSGGTHDPRNL
jgi:hypothetical protein